MRGGTAEFTTRLFAGGLTRRQFLAIVCLFWVYVTVSNLLYGYSMRTGIAHLTTVMVFAAWDQRLLQHVLLLPMVLVSFWASLKVQWRPLLITLPLQVILGAVFAAAAYPVMILSQVIIGGDEMHGTAMSHVMGAWSDPFWGTLWLASFVSFLPASGFGLALVTGLALYTRFRNSELHVAALEREWSAARLAALRMQLSPHTLFNLLHTIRGYIEWDPKGAQAMVVQLGDLLRRLLNAGEREFSLLADELQFVRLYLELQQKRFADRLTILLPAPGDTADLWVPSLILQPLVENAVVHGLAGHEATVLVRVEVQIDDDSVILRVVNTIAKAYTAGPDAIGLNNVRERLDVQFGADASFTAGPTGSEEWTAEITIP